MYSLVAHDRLQENKPYDENSIGDRVIPNDATVNNLNHQVQLLILLKYGSDYSVKIIVLEVTHIALIWK